MTRNRGEAPLKKKSVTITMLHLAGAQQLLAKVQLSSYLQIRQKKQLLANTVAK